MTPDAIKFLLTEVAAGRVSVADAEKKLSGFPADLIHGADGKTPVARLDRQREARQGFPEVILAEGKRKKHLSAILERAVEREGDLLVTRVSAKRGRLFAERFPQLTHDPEARALYRKSGAFADAGLVAVFCAGTSDIPVAAEAALTARMLGAKVETRFDAGVAGLHRLLAASDLLKTARVFVVVAGMEGALPSVVGGLVNKPVIAVPTSKGYGAAFGGLSALLGMLNSCAANVTAVNIDNGFGAGFTAGLINRFGTP